MGGGVRHGGGKSTNRYAGRQAARTLDAHAGPMSSLLPLPSPLHPRCLSSCRRPWRQRVALPQLQAPWRWWQPPLGRPLPHQTLPLHPSRAGWAPPVVPGLQVSTRPRIQVSACSHPAVGGDGCRWMVMCVRACDQPPNTRCTHLRLAALQQLAQRANVAAHELHRACLWQLQAATTLLVPVLPHYHHD